ncbi:hypothetical protein JI75_08585 [Berryella intestinalis]|uniref:Uncharacterized protein n=1 Tax=Berryella intestinalis TaxID=1531429 RepID=A0A0A8BC11_9ACTN|nr:hypothetical protein [Berryella intestinalis]AJC12697.1 hypothetical protein JI75_08585 [Berryella intestinalis]
MPDRTHSPKAHDAQRQAEPAVPESQRFTASYRAIRTDEAVKVYNGAGMRSVSRVLSFDPADEEFSALDECACAILSEILLLLGDEFHRRGEDLMDVEARAHVTVENPLAALGVRGVEGTARIASVRVEAYLFTFMDEPQARTVIDGALARATLYQSLKDALSITCRFSLTE